MAPLSDLEKHRLYDQHRYPERRDAMLAQKRQSRKQNPDTFRARWLKHAYGISIETYDTILKSQDGVCALCTKSCATGKRLAVDHCHSTGKIRGLLCSHCNRSLGAYEKNKDRYEEYLA